MQFSRTYLDLGEAFYQPSTPRQFSSPKMLLFNHALAEELGFDEPWINNEHELGLYLSGQRYFNDESPVALAYSGHQFGQFNPTLGDGRAHYLTDIINREHKAFELQLKGSGPTPFSRGGDGLCAIGPALREYVMSAAMTSLRVPSARSLSVVKTGDKVFRNGVVDGAVVSRVARSHIRVGTFQYFAYRGDVDSLRTLADFVLEQYVDTNTVSNDHDGATRAEKYLKLLEWVVEKQVKLIVEWMRVGFVHGVMNTDNCSIVGDTIDFGPCAMLGIYDPDTTYSSIDQHKRYAFGNQPQIALWNLTRFAECLIPLINREEPDKAVALLEPVLNQYSDLYSKHYYTMMRSKMGLSETDANANQLVDNWLSLLIKHRLDYTNGFYGLIETLTDGSATEIQFQGEVADFVFEWQQLIGNSGLTESKRIELMQRYNPYVIPRNHLVEQAISDCAENDDLSTVNALLDAMKTPYEKSSSKRAFAAPPADGDCNYVTFCGT